MSELLVIIPCWLVAITIELAITRFFVGLVNGSKEYRNTDTGK